MDCRCPSSIAFWQSFLSFLQLTATGLSSTKTDLYDDIVIPTVQRLNRTEASDDVMFRAAWRALAGPHKVSGMYSPPMEPRKAPGSGGAVSCFGEWAYHKAPKRGSPERRA